jgi:iron complex outermembrane receptor protein
MLVQTTTPEVVQVTTVKANPTEQGVEVILQTTLGEQLTVVNRSAGNSYIADIPNAQLRLPSGDGFAFGSQKPITGITQITVTNADANTIRVTVGDEGLIFGVKSAVASSPQGQQPQTQGAPQPVAPEIETQGAESAPQEEDDIEIVVTGEQETGYRVPDASTATRTDTPLRDIPQSIQVIPQEVIEDRNVTELGDALETAGGVVSAGGRGTSVFGPDFLIRGFEVSNSVFREGIPYFSLSPLSTNDIERVEVLKGPASVLFGQGEPGGVINLVSKKPLNEPFYSASFTAGNFDTYRGTLDFSGPLNESRTVKYRLNVSYENYDSFRNFVEGERLIFSPTLTWDIGTNTSINFYGQYTNNRETIDEGIVAFGNGIVDVPRDRFLGEEFGEFEQEQFNLGYTLNHRISEDWSVRQALQYTQYKPIRFAPLFDSFDEETGELSRLEYYADGTYDRFFTNAEVIGKFNTGSIQHQLLFGAEYRRNTEDPRFQFSNLYTSI